jgi:syntaxin 1B/2/3
MDLLLDDIGKSVEDIRKHTAQDAKTSDEKRRQAIIQQINTLISNVTRNAKEIKDMFIQIKEDNQAFAAKPEHAHSARAQVRQNLYEVHIRRFQDVMLKFSDARELYRNSMHSRIARHIKNVDVNVTDDQVEELIESGQAHTIISEALASDNLRSVVDELRDRNKALLLLQRNVESLYQMFKDLHTLIELQGETINVVENRITSALDYTRKGKVELEKAQEYQTKARKCQCGIFIVLLIILVIVAIPVIISQVQSA